MVSSIVPGATSVGALAVDPRYTRSAAQANGGREEGASGDRVEISGPAAWAASRESVAGGLTQVQQALGVGRDAQTLLLKVQGIADDPGSTQADLDAALQDYSARYDTASGQGAALIVGQSVSVQAEPSGPPLTIAGADLALKAQPDGIIGVSSQASLDNRAALAQAAQSSLDRVQGFLDHLSDAQRALQAHQGFLGAAQNTIAGVSDLNADSARLLALQVRQGLEAVGNAPIANVEPQAVLALFRA